MRTVVIAFRSNHYLRFECTQQAAEDLVSEYADAVGQGRLVLLISRHTAIRIREIEAVYVERSSERQIPKKETTWLQRVLRG